MPYVFDETQAGEKISAYDFPSLTSEVLTETFAQAYEENPIEAVRRANELRKAHQSGTWLDAATARQRLADRGMQSDITVSDAGITEDALNTLMFRKGIEKHRQEVFGLSEGGLDQGAARLGIGLGTSLVDPLSIVTAFVPVVGQTRYGVMLGKAAGSLGRAGVRVGVGAVEGAAGAAILEPIIAGSRRYEQADYDMADSLMNVTFGGVFGAGLHSVGGAISDGVNAYYDARSQIPRGDLSGMDRVYETRFARQIDRNLSGAIRDYGKIEGSEGGKILNTDLASELSADYRADRTRSAAVHEPASYLVKQIYERRLAEPAQPNERVIFSGGGTGAGKTTGLRRFLDMLAKFNDDIRNARIIYDTNLNGLQSSVKKIEQALASGRNVDIVYTYRHPVDALVNGVLPRAKRMGRTVPLEEHAKTHVGSLDTVRELSQKYAGDDRVRIHVIDNSHGKGNARLSSVEALPRLDYNAVVRELDAALEAAYKSGAITDAIYRGTKGNGAPQRGGRSARQSVGRGPEQGGDGRGLGPEEQLIAATPIQRETALKQAVVNGALDTPINPQADAADVRGALDAAQKTLAREIDTGTPTADNLRAAQEEMSLAQSDLKALADRLGVEAEDASIREINEAAANADRWAKVANLATVCLVRGG